MSLLEVKNLKVHFPVKHGLFSRVRGHVKAVDDVSLSIEPGETLGLVGESGCGKTTLGRAIIRLIEPTAGQVIFKGEDITQLHGSELRRRRRGFQMIFQDPYGSLNPRMTVEQIIGEAIDIHNLAESSGARRARINELLQAVGLNAAHAQRYPARIQRRPTPAHRHRARARGRARTSSCATNPSARSTSPCRRRSSICSWTCSSSAASPICSSRTISPSSNTSAGA